MDSPGRRLAQWEKGHTPGPWFVSLFPTNRCNLRCAICWQRRVEIDYSTEIPDERLLRLVDECADIGVKEWVIVGGGEPMVRDSLVIQLCERIRRYNMNGRIQTNGIRFHESHFQRLVELQWTSVVFSIDGPTQEINDEIRSPGSFIGATANIRRFAAIRRELNAKLPRLSITTVVTNTNYDKLHQMVELTSELGCDSIGGGHLTPESEIGKHFSLSPEEIKTLPSHIARADQRARELGVEHSLNELLLTPSRSGAAATFPPPAPADAKGIERAACLEPWLSIQVQPDGKIGPCCVFWDTEAQSIRDLTLKDIWLGPYMTKVRNDFLAGRFQPYCASCHSSFRIRDKSFREQLAVVREAESWHNENPIGRVSRIMTKAAASIQKHGLRGALKRGRDWFRLIHKH